MEDTILFRESIYRSAALQHLIKDEDYKTRITDQLLRVMCTPMYGVHFKRVAVS